jgi:hypothetical protein
MSYRIGDEPRPGALARVAVDPMWPLLAVMLGGVWLSWPWFVLNGVAVGSPTRRRELLWAVGGFLAEALLLLGGVVLVARFGLVGAAAAYALLPITVWKLAVSYVLYSLQVRTFHLYRYFGGTVGNGVLVAAAAMFVRPQLLKLLPPWLAAVLS